MRNLHIFLGASVADAAARPLHWVYDPKKLKQYIKGKKEIAFLKKSRSPFYSIKTGKVSGYNDVGQVMFKTLISTKKKSDVLKNFKRNVVKNFGPGSAYWKNLKLRKKYKKIKWKGPMNGPWIHQNILETIQNIKSKKNIIFFSPAGASFDSFKNFEERGSYFNKLIKRYINERKII